MVGAGLYAVWFPAYYVERMVRLEALSTLLLLVCLLLCARLGSSSRPTALAAAAGVLVGLTAVVKLWGLLPVAVVIGWLLWEHGLRRALVAAAGALVAVVAVMLPFAIAGPAWFHYLVANQLGRDRAAGSLTKRLLDILALGPVPSSLSLAALAAGVLLTIAALVLAFRTPAGRLYALLAGTGVAALLSSPTWYSHYPAFVAAPLCLVFGIAAGAVSGWVRRPALRMALVGVVLAALAGALVLLLGHSAGARFPGRQLENALRERPGCITSDRPAASMILSNTLRRNLAAGCPVVVDILGYRFASEHREPTEHAAMRYYWSYLTQYLATGSTAVLVKVPMDSLEPDDRARIRSWPIVDEVGRLELREPR